MKIILSNRLWVPKKAWKNIPLRVRKKIAGRFKKTFISPTSYCELRINNQFCANCRDALINEGIEEANKICKECPVASFSLSCAFKGKKYISFYRGDLEKIDDLIKTIQKYEKIEVTDKRTTSPLKKKIVINDTGDDRSKNQDELADAYVKKGYGILVAPARFGKTRMACVVASKLNQRTFVIAHQKELLEQFQANWIKFSSLTKDEIKINPSVEEAKTIPVNLFTYQHFLNTNGTKRLKELKKVPGLVIIDEAHRAAAKGFNKVNNAFYARYRLGITATPDRKDNLSFLIYNTFGPITAKGGVEMLSCRYKVIKTNVIFSDYTKVPHRRKFVLLQKAMTNSTERNEVIANRAVRNVTKGHKVLIPLKSVSHVKEIAKLVRQGLKKKGYKDVRVCEFSAFFLKGKAREEAAQKIREGFYDVVVAVESMINVGFDAPKMSNLILNAGTYSFNNANRYQLFSRIRTRCEGKKTPLIDILSDECKMSDYSLRATIAQLKEFGFKEVSKKKKKEKTND